MMTTVEIPTVLRQYCGGESELRISAGTPKAVLTQLEKLHPELYRCVCNETGCMRPHVNLFVNNKLIRGDFDWTCPLKRGDVVGIFQAVSGG